MQKKWAIGVSASALILAAGIMTYVIANLRAADPFTVADLRCKGSFSHIAFANLNYWAYYGLGGLRPDARYPGFKHFNLVPQVPADMEYARVWHESPYGRIVSNWEKKEGTFCLGGRRSAQHDRHRPHPGVSPRSCHGVRPAARLGQRREVREDARRARRL